MNEIKSSLSFKIYFTSFRHRLNSITNESPILKISLRLLGLFLLYYYYILNNSFITLSKSIEILESKIAIENLVSLVSESVILMSFLIFILTYFISVFTNQSYKNNLFFTLGLTPYNSMIKTHSIFFSTLFSIFFMILGIIVVVINFICVDANIFSKSYINEPISMVLIFISYNLLFLAIFFLIPFLFGYLGGVFSYILELILSFILYNKKKSQYEIPLNLLLVLLFFLIVYSISSILDKNFQIQVARYFIFEISRKFLTNLGKGTLNSSFFINGTLFILEIALMYSIISYVFNFNFKIIKHDKIRELKKKENRILFKLNNLANIYDYTGTRRVISQFIIDSKLILRTDIFVGTYVTSIILFFLILIGRVFFTESSTANDSLSLGSFLKSFLPFIFILSLIIYGLFIRTIDSGMDSFLFTSSYNFKKYAIIKFGIALIFPILFGFLFITLLDLLSTPFIDFLYEILPGLILIISFATLASFLSSYIVPSSINFDTNQLILSIIIFMILETIYITLEEYSTNFSSNYVIIILSCFSLFLCLYLKNPEIA